MRSTRVISPMIAGDIKNSRSAFNRTREISERSRSRRRPGLGGTTGLYVRPPWLAEISRASFRYSWPWGLDEKTLLGIGAAEEEGRRETSRFITSYRRGARPMRNCLCSCPALSDASDTFERTYHIYAVRAGENGRRTRRIPYLLLLVVLHLFVSSSRLRLLMARPRPIPRSVSLVTMTKLAPRVHPPFLYSLSLSLVGGRARCVRAARVTSIDAACCRGGKMTRNGSPAREQSLRYP